MNYTYILFAACCVMSSVKAAGPDEREEITIEEAALGRTIVTRVASSIAPEKAVADDAPSKKPNLIMYITTPCGGAEVYYAEAPKSPVRSMPSSIHQAWHGCP